MGEPVGIGFSLPITHIEHMLAEVSLARWVVASLVAPTTGALECVSLCSRGVEGRRGRLVIHLRPTTFALLGEEFPVVIVLKVREEFCCVENSFLHT
jgi:hypothetical protein